MSDGCVNLVGKLSRWSDDQGNGTRLRSGHGDLLEELQERENIGQCLSRPRLRVDNDVAPTHNQRDALHLDGLRCL